MTNGALVEQLRLVEDHAHEYGWVSAVSDSPAIAADPEIAAAVTQIKLAERALRSRIAELKEDNWVD